jgi:hypothetical protein
MRARSTWRAGSDRPRAHCCKARCWSSVNSTGGATRARLLIIETLRCRYLLLITPHYTRSARCTSSESGGRAGSPLDGIRADGLGPEDEHGRAQLRRCCAALLNIRLMVILLRGAPRRQNPIRMS